MALVGVGIIVFGLISIGIGSLLVRDPGRAIEILLPLETQEPSHRVKRAYQVHGGLVIFAGILVVLLGFAFLTV